VIIFILSFLIVGSDHHCIFRI